MIHALVMSGQRVGITAFSHRAIENLLLKVVEVFEEKGDHGQLRGVRKRACVGAKAEGLPKGRRVDSREIGVQCGRGYGMAFLQRTDARRAGRCVARRRGGSARPCLICKCGSPERVFTRHRQPTSLLQPEAFGLRSPPYRLTRQVQRFTSVEVSVENRPRRRSDNSSPSHTCRRCGIDRSSVTTAIVTLCRRQRRLEGRTATVCALSAARYSSCHRTQSTSTMKAPSSSSQSP